MIWTFWFPITVFIINSQIPLYIYITVYSLSLRSALTSTTVCAECRGPENKNNRNGINFNKVADMFLSECIKNASFSLTHLTLSILRYCKFLVIEAKSLHEDRSILDRSNSDISELMLRGNQDKCSSIFFV